MPRPFVHTSARWYHSVYTQTIVSIVSCTPNSARVQPDEKFARMKKGKKRKDEQHNAQNNVRLPTCNFEVGVGLCVLTPLLGLEMDVEI
jgi:hypothetical protein